MSKKYLYIIIVMLAVSNGFFIYSTYVWQNEWHEQFLTTFDVETMFKEDEQCHVTYAGLLQGEHSHKYKKTQPRPEAKTMSVAMSEGMKEIVGDDVGLFLLKIDEKTLQRNDTLFYFNNGEYTGSSKAKLLSNGPWLLGLFP